MLNTRKQKSRPRNSRDADMLSDFEKLHKKLGSNHLERDESELSNSVRRPASPSYNALVKEEVNSLSNSREDEIRGYSGNGQPFEKDDSSSEILR